MTPETRDLEEVSIPALLRAARRTYGGAIGRGLAEVGIEDMPRNGVFVINTIARLGSPLSEIIDALGISKQAAGQLVDTLVTRGYLDRAPDPEDRRKMTVALTERGRLAAETARAAIDQVDSALVARVGAAAIASTRATLFALIADGLLSEG
jgi:DNA-binding MarR family transcriptional regulator